MNEQQLFEHYFTHVHGMTVSLDDTVWEALTMYYEELDPMLFPEEVLTHLPDPLLILSAHYDDETGHEWFLFLATDGDDTSRWLYGGCMKDRELVSKNIPLEY